MSSRTQAPPHTAPHHPQQLDFGPQPSYVMHTRWLARPLPPHPRPHTAWKEGGAPAWVCGPHFLIRQGNFFPQASSRLPLHPVSRNCIASPPPASTGARPKQRNHNLMAHNIILFSSSSLETFASPQTALPSHLAVASLLHHDPLVPGPCTF